MVSIYGILCRSVRNLIYSRSRMEYNAHERQTKPIPNTSKIAASGPSMSSLTNSVRRPLSRSHTTSSLMSTWRIIVPACQRTQKKSFANFRRLTAIKLSHTLPTKEGDEGEIKLSSPANGNRGRGRTIEPVSAHESSRNLWTNSTLVLPIPR